MSNHIKIDQHEMEATTTGQFVLNEGLADSDPTCSIDPSDWDQCQTDPAATKPPVDLENYDSGATIVPNDFAMEPLESISSEQRERGDQIADAYSKAWTLNQHPRLADFLPTENDEQLRNYVAFLLVTIDIEQRQQRKQPISEQDYLSVAPDCQRAIASALTRRSASRPTEFRRSPIAIQKRTTPAEDALSNWSIETSLEHKARYEPMQMHARGGLGAVYRGKDSELGRLVALKRILPGREDDPNTRARFVFEAEVTGSLEHPGIVPVYGLSCYGESRPYYAMRFVKGTSFTKAIQEFHAQNPEPSSNDFQDREFRLLMRRLIDCCNAMHYAHERGVLHRDLKPDNIMLGQYGETLVVDWGLAKILKQPEPPTSASPDADTLPELDSQLSIKSDIGQTSVGTIVGTPLYMSPEQALGLQDELTPLADVYSLGAMLFTIASNTHAVEGKSTRDVIMNVREGKLRDLRATAPRIPHALISICEKAMATVPEDRYGSAVSLADDIDRWLSSDSVHAHTESLTEKATRLFRRYSSQALIGAASLMLIAIIAMLAALLIYGAKRQEEIAKIQATQFKGEAIERYRDSRQAIDSWLVQSSDALEYFPGTRSVRARLLSLATQDYERLASVTSDDPELELERARALIRLGDLNRTQENHGEAQDHYRAAINLLTSGPREITEANLEKSYAAETANAHARLALDLADDNQIEEANREYEIANLGLSELASEDGNAAANRYLSAALVNWASVALTQNQYDFATDRLRNSLSTIERIPGNLLPEDHLLTARAEELLGRLAVSQGNISEAISILTTATERMTPLVQSNPDDPSYLDASASLLISLASAQRGLGRVDREITSLTIAVDRYRSLKRAVPDLPRHAENLALTLTDLGLILNDQHRCRDALPPLTEAAELLSDLIRDYGQMNRYRDMQSACHDAIAQVQLSLGDHELAVDQATRSIMEYQTLSEQFPERPDYYERLAVAQSHYSQIIAASPDPTDETISAAEQGFETSVETLKELIGVFPETPQYQVALAFVHEQQGRFFAESDRDRSSKSFDSAIETFTSLGDARDPVSSDRLAWILLTRVPADSRNSAEAISIAQDALSNYPENNSLRCTLVTAQVINNEITDAAATLAPITGVGGERRTGREWFALAIVEAASGNADAAASAKERGLAWYEDQSPSHPDLGIWEELFSPQPAS